MSDVTLPLSYPADPTEARSLMEQQIFAVITGERDAVANMANVAAILGHGLTGINWVGFYRVKGPDLVLGPFWGAPACVRISFGRGVCGTAWQRAQTLMVDDVLAFPGHIACDARSRSEIVVPLSRDGKVFGVLDCDAPVVGRFGALERGFLEGVAGAVALGSDWGD